ncbi:Hypothetical protein WANG_0607 [Lactobacillus kefiranofaciens subsp. kefiranofaciens]|nr:Hypothetical protein WANG_0607 [Lactobacillus kefiranofaciens subsp. kefiranofaciens]
MIPFIRNRLYREIIGKDMKKKQQRHQKHRKYLAMKVELVNGQPKWFRISPKFFQIIITEQRLRKIHPRKMLTNCLINIPLTTYSRHNQAVIGVGRVIKMEYRAHTDTRLCVRGQFTPPEKLKKEFFLTYHYLRHDYGKLSKINIMFDLYFWRRKVKQNHLTNSFF